MKVDLAITEAITTRLRDATDQTDEFQRRFRELITLALEGNYRDADIRRVLDLVAVEPEDEA